MTTYIFLEKRLLGQALTPQRFRKFSEEAISVIQMLRTITEPVEEQAVKNGDFQGRIQKLAPASRYLDSGIITFPFLRGFLVQSQRTFAYKFSTLMDYFP